MKSEELESLLRDVHGMERRVERMEDLITSMEERGYNKVSDVVVEIADVSGRKEKHQLIINRDLEDTIMTLVKAYYLKRINEIGKELDNIKVIGGKDYDKA